MNFVFIVHIEFKKKIYVNTFGWTLSGKLKIMMFLVSLTCYRFRNTMHPIYVAFEVHLHAFF